jgi:hypothetical protein
LVVKVVTGSGLAGAVEELDEVGLGWQPAGDVAGSRVDHPNRRVGIDVRVVPWTWTWDTRSSPNRCRRCAGACSGLNAAYTELMLAEA